MYSNGNRSLTCLCSVGTYCITGKSEVSRVLHKAIYVGYRHIDTAHFYSNEKDIGDALREIDVPRAELFITTKMWYTEHGYDSALKAFETSYQKLGLDYIDLYLIHWPGTNKFPPQANKKLRKQTWEALEKLVDDGKVRSIGVSNYTVDHLKELLEYCRIKPAVNQVELHPKLTQQPLIEYCNANGIVVEAYSSLAKGRLLRDVSVVKMAEKYKKTTSQVLLRWGLQHGLVVIPKSSSDERIEENFNLFDFEISADDMQALDDMNEDWHCTWDPTDIP
eukprot:TRINITY_DN7715_c0_g1_i4.p1 TRINITY_DN7715_c0_g1~~TRINITY_DN7715_c0_g1_i4.p1  ORF type:complete len:278 (+),score=78.79 TRINITY_DN7715_c0_g1_i4:160-993(+)